MYFFASLSREAICAERATISFFCYLLGVSMYACTISSLASEGCKKYGKVETCLAVTIRPEYRV